MFDFSKNNFEVVPTGIYFAKLQNKPEIKESGFYKDPEGNPQKYVLYKFEILSNNLGQKDQAGVVVIAKPGPRSPKNMDIYNALTGQELEKIQTDGAELEGKVCQLVITKMTGTNGEARNRIDAFIPMQQNTVHPANAPEAVAAPPTPPAEGWTQPEQPKSDLVDENGQIDPANIPF